MTKEEARKKGEEIFKIIKQAIEKEHPLPTGGREALDTLPPIPIITPLNTNRFKGE